MPGPALATLTKQRFSRDGWIFERKLDGMRVLASRSGDDGADLRSRRRAATRAAASRRSSTPWRPSTYPDFVIDGEVVAFDRRQTSFGRLQQRMHVSNPDQAPPVGVTVHYYVFDLLHLDGHTTRGLPLRERKALLQRPLDWDDPLRFTPAPQH